MKHTSVFQGKKITLMGLGLLGRGVGDAQFLAEHCAELTVTDLKTEEDIADSIKKLEGYENINFVLGEHRMQDFKNADMIIKAAGVPLDSPYIKAAHDAGVPVKMSTSLFAELSPATIVGITGTRGKTTVTHLLYEILKASEKNVFLGGNIQGVSTLKHLPESKKGEIAVLELDSWQLQGFGHSKISPHIAIFTSFFQDHMDYYKGDTPRYLDDKANIFRYQKEDDIFVASTGVKDILLEKYKNEIKANVLWADSSDIPANWKLSMPGEHSRANAVCAIAAARKLGAEEDVIKEIVEKFKGVPNRLEYVATINSIDVYNDTAATTPDATVAALNALGTKKNIVLIAGGSDKGLSIEQLREPLSEYCKEVVLLPGKGTEKLENSFNMDELEVKKHSVQDMNEAVETAFGVANAGDVILLSPAFASFGLFKNEYDRGEQFLNALNSVQTSA